LREFDFSRAAYSFSDTSPAASANALVVGNYLTTLNQRVEKDLQMLKDLGLDPDWDSHDFSDQEETSSACGKENCEPEAELVPAK
jgi:biotin synthase-like enzyme